MTAASSLIPAGLQAALERVTPRQCRACGVSFQAPGMVTLCEQCEQPASNQPVIVRRELGDSWPNRHRERLGRMVGASLRKAQSLESAVLASGMIVLAGDRGRGKTQMATWLGWRRGQRGLRCGLYAKAFDLFGDVKSTWGKNAARTEARVIQDYKAAPFLCLDECHERGETDWENRTLRNILDHRYDSMLPTVIIGNWKSDAEIADCLGASITDRITETGGIVWCNWASYRVGGE